MSFQTPIQTTNRSRSGLKAELLLASTDLPDIDLLGAAVLTALGETGTSLTDARKNQDKTGLVLRTKAATLLIKGTGSPLAAQHFSGGLTPFASAAERAAQIAIIGHHEASVTLKIRPVSPSDSNAVDLLYQGVSALSQTMQPLGIMWGPTRRLHRDAAFQALPRSRAPVELLFAPVCKKFGPRHMNMLHFTGGRDVFGFQLFLQLSGMDRDEAITAGLALAHACRLDPTIAQNRSFAFVRSQGFLES